MARGRFVMVRGRFVMARGRFVMVRGSFCNGPGFRGSFCNGPGGRFVIVRRSFCNGSGDGSCDPGRSERSSWHRRRPRHRFVMVFDEKRSLCNRSVVVRRSFCNGLKKRHRFVIGLAWLRIVVRWSRDARRHFDHYNLPFVMGFASCSKQRTTGAGTGGGRMHLHREETAVSHHMISPCIGHAGRRG